MKLLTLIPDRVRKIVYIVYTATGVGIGAVQVGYVAASAEQPMALTVALAVYAYLGIALGLTAASNVQTTDGSGGYYGD